MADPEKYLRDIIDNFNNQWISDFEGYSPAEMQGIIYDPFGDGPVQLKELPEEDYQKIPLLNQIKYLLKIIDERGALQLTKKGFLPTKIVSDLYGQGYMKDKVIESGIYKLYKETDSITLVLTRIMALISGLTKKRKNKLSLTRKGQSLMNNDLELLALIFKTFGMRVNWAYFDNYGNNNIGQAGFAFSLILLAKYGEEMRPSGFYAEKYFRAFPFLIDEIEEDRFFNDKQVIAYRCYSVRTFERFLKYFGIIKIHPEDSWAGDFYVMKTDLFDKFIQCRPHQRTDQERQLLN